MKAFAFLPLDTDSKFTPGFSTPRGLVAVVVVVVVEGTASRGLKGHLRTYRFPGS